VSVTVKLLIDGSAHRLVTRAHLRWTTTVTVLLITDGSAHALLPVRTAGLCQCEGRLAVGSAHGHNDSTGADQRSEAAAAQTADVRSVTV
jgi:hypothetical protein